MPINLVGSGTDNAVAGISESNLRKEENVSVVFCLDSIRLFWQRILGILVPFKSLSTVSVLQQKKGMVGTLIPEQTPFVLSDIYSNMYQFHVMVCPKCLVSFRMSIQCLTQAFCT